MSEPQTIDSSQVKKITMSELLKGKVATTPPPPMKPTQPSPPLKTTLPVSSFSPSPIPSVPKNIPPPTQPPSVTPTSQVPPPATTPQAPVTQVPPAAVPPSPVAPVAPPPIAQPPTSAPVILQPTEPQPTVPTTAGLPKGLRPIYGLTPEGTVRKASMETAKKALVTEETVPEVITFYGDKGDGKSHTALSLPGTIVALQFDKKTAVIWKNDYKSDPRIKVYDATMLEAYSDGSVFQESSIENFKHINLILDIVEQDPPDWILVDGLERLSEICEQMMRARNNFKPFQGVEWTYWKERRIYLRQIHARIIRIARRGVVYTTYVDTKELMKDGKVNDSKEIPKYIDMVLQETDDVIRLYSENDKRTNTTRFWAYIDSSKGTFKVGERREITGRGLEAFPELAKLSPRSNGS